MKITVENTPKHSGEYFWAEPIPRENSWRVRRSFDGQNVLYRGDKTTAETFAKAMNEKKETPDALLAAPEKEN